MDRGAVGQHFDGPHALVPGGARDLRLRYVYKIYTPFDGFRPTKLPDRIGREFYDELRRHYSEEEIVELGAFIGFNIGYHTFFGTLKFYPMFSPDGRLISQEEAQRIYGAAPGSLKKA